MPLHAFDATGAYPKARGAFSAKHTSEAFADAAVEFLRGEEAKGKPFLLYCAFTAPHDPRVAPPEFLRLYENDPPPLPANFLPEHPFDNGDMKVRDETLLPRPRDPQKVRAELALYYATISHLDAQIGRILDALDASGKAENTLVIFISDHGLALGSHGLLGKQSLYDHSMRAPCILRGPGVPRGGRRSAQCYLFDLFPTACELAGIAAPPGLEGKSLAPLFSKPDAEIRDHLFLAYKDVQRALRTPEWKLIRYPKIGREQLFHLTDDPDEMRDLAADPRHAARLAELRLKLDAAQKENGDPLAQ